MCEEWVDVLELVQLVLPATVELQSHLDAAENHFLAPLEIDSKLDDISIIDRKRLRLLPGRAKPYVIQKGATAALDVLDVPFAILVPKLAMPATHYFGFEADRR